MFKAFSTAALLAVAGSASADLYLNEVLGSTSSSDAEFIEIYNSGPSAVDLTGYSIELWDSDSGSSFGSLDAGAPYTIGAVSIPAGGFVVFANTIALGEFAGTIPSPLSSTGDGLLPSNSIENSSYTIILKDTGSSVVDAVFVKDSGASDVANDAGNPIVAPQVGPDGTFLPAGFFRTTDGGSTFGILNFSLSDLPDGTSEGGTPGASNVIPEPASLALMGAGLAVAGLRRRSA